MCSRAFSNKRKGVKSEVRSSLSSKVKLRYRMVGYISNKQEIHIGKV